MNNWHIITSEYPPQIGGVSDYTKLVATALAAAGDEVHVWCPADEEPEVRGQSSEIGDCEPEARASGPGKLVVHREFGRFAPADLRRVGRELDRFPGPRRLLVQWVAQGYGYRSINLAFCWWLWRRAKFKRDRVELMVHEPFLAFGEGSPKQDLAATVHRLMIVILLQASSRIWVSIPDWEKQLRPFALSDNKRFDWLPVPSSIPVVEDAESETKVRARYALNGTRVVGHFGAYYPYMTRLMLKLLPSLLDGDNQVSVLLIGKGSSELRDQLVELHPDLAEQVYASGVLSADDVSRHIGTCDVMLQPYQDGVSGRRTSVMSALSHGVPVVTTRGKATESCWLNSDGVKVTDVDDFKGLAEVTRSLLSSKLKKGQLSAAAHELYSQNFDITNTIRALRTGSK